MKSTIALLMGIALFANVSVAADQETSAGKDLQRVRAENRLLRAQNSSQKKRIQTLEDQVKTLTDKTASLTKEVARLRLILAKTRGGPTSGPAQPKGNATYFVIPIKGVIGKEFTAAETETYLKQAAQLSPTVVVLDIDTNGGLIEDAEKILGLIGQFKGLRFVACVHRALSAGAVITLACREIYVTENAMMGAATSYTVGHDRLPKALAEKLQSVWRAVCRRAAETGGHAALIAEAMVDPDFALTMRKANGKVVIERDGKGDVLKAKGKILTLTAAEAIKCRLAIGLVKDQEDLGKQLGMVQIARPPEQVVKPKLGPGKYVYRGRKVTDAWFEKQFKKYRNRIAFVNGRYIDIGSLFPVDNAGKVYNRVPDMDRNPPGAVYKCRWATKYYCTVHHILNDDEALIVKRDEDSRLPFIFHVKGVTGMNLVNNARFHRCLVYVGGYKYRTTDGAQKTVQSYVVYRPLTKEQFAQALANGFKLMTYRFKGNKVIAIPVR